MNSEEIINKASLKNLTQEETSSVMEDIFLGHISDQKIEDFLLNLSKKGETSDELTGAVKACLLYTSPSPRDLSTSRMPSSA